MLKTAIVELERATKSVAKKCDMGFEHLVPGQPEIIWLVMEIGDEDDVTVASKKAFEKYPVEDGWRIRFGTVNVVALMKITRDVDTHGE